MATLVGVKDAPFNAAGNGTTDDTAAIQAAINSNPGTLYFPPGTYKVSATLTVANPLVLLGAGPRAAVIKTVAATGDVVSNTAPGFAVKSLGFDAAVTRTGGAYVKTTGWYGSAQDVALTRHYLGFDVDGVVGFDLATVFALDGTQSGVQAGGAIVRIGNTNYCGNINVNGLEADIDFGLTDAQKRDVTKQPSYGILFKYCDVGAVTNCLIIHHGDDLAMTPGGGQFVALVAVSNCDFDTASRGIRIQPAGGRVLQCKFAQVWSGAHAADAIMLYAPSPLSPTTGIRGIHFSGVTAYASGQIGVNIVGPGVTDVTFVDCQAASNGLAGTSNGVQLTGGATNVAWLGGVVGATDGVGENTGFGFAVDATSTGVLRDARVTPNTAGPLSNANPANFLTDFWHAETVAVSAQVGSLSHTATLRYVRVNKTVHFALRVANLPANTGAGAVKVTLPAGLAPPASGVDFVFAGREVAVTGKMLQGILTAGTGDLYVLYFDNTYPGAAGNYLSLTGTYEVG